MSSDHDTPAPVPKNEGDLQAKRWFVIVALSTFAYVGVSFAYSIGSDVHWKNGEIPGYDTCLDKMNLRLSKKEVSQVEAEKYCCSWVGGRYEIAQLSQAKKESSHLLCDKESY